MGVHYEVKTGESLVISGPANVTVKGGEMPMIVDDATTIADQAPAITALNPDSIESGADDIVLVIDGTGFTPQSTIVFGDQDEPTTVSEDGAQVSTGVKPALFAPAAVPVQVRNGPARSAPVDFTFLDPGAVTTSKKRKPKHGDED